MNMAISGIIIHFFSENMAVGANKIATQTTHIPLPHKAPPTQSQGAGLGTGEPLSAVHWFKARVGGAKGISLRSLVR